MKVKEYGLDSLPVSARTAGWTDLFVIWAGASFCLPAFIIGALLVPAFSWHEAVLINLLGNLIVGIFIVLGGSFGVKTGLPAVIWGRYVFGYPLGQWIPAIFLIVSMLGWYAVITEMTALALDAIILDLTGFSSPIFLIILVGFSFAYTAVLGYQKIRKLSWLSVPLLSLVCIYITVKLFMLNSGFSAVNYQPAGFLTRGEGIDIIIGGSMAGAFIASDLSRFTRKHYHNWLGVLSGVFLISFLLGLMGMLSQVVTGNWNPLLIVQNLGMGIPAVLFIILTSWTNNDNILYSAGLALTGIFPHMGRRVNTALCAIIGTALALAGITQMLETWLMWISYLFSPLIGVLLMDNLVADKITKRDPVNVLAIVAVAAGIAIAVLTPEKYISSLIGMVASAVIYLLFSVLNRK